MSWGTTYKYEGYLSHIGKDEIDEKIEECESNLKDIYAEMLAYMAQTPPAYAKYDDGEETCPWPEFIARKMDDLKDELEENLFLLCRLRQCQEVLKEHPEDVEEG